MKYIKAIWAMRHAKKTTISGYGDWYYAHEVWAVGPITASSLWKLFFNIFAFYKYPEA